MDFLDSLDLDLSHKKSRRVRSWYLYEQFKSLERNQLDATRQLKDRSFQDKILRQELLERKARRKLYDQSSLYRAESQSEASVKSKDTLNTSRSDTYKSFHELCDDGLDTSADLIGNSNDSQAFYDDYPLNYCRDDFKSIVDQADEQSYAESTTSVVNVKSTDTVTENGKYQKKQDQLELNFDEVKEKLECLEKLTQRDYERSSTCETLRSGDEKEMDIVLKGKNVNTPDNNIHMMWSRLVSFAYQLMQLNHGNCYYDYGSQFMTAVLACDVLRRGINRMCYILQPYVSPIKFATDSESSLTHKKFKRKKPSEKRSKEASQKHRKTFTKTRSNVHHSQTARRYRSEEFWDQISPRYHQAITYHHKLRRRSEPWGSHPKSQREDPILKSSYGSLRPDFSDEEKNYHKSSSKKVCHCGRKVINPMLELSQYLDTIMREVEEPFV